MIVQLFIRGSGNYSFINVTLEYLHKNLNYAVMLLFFKGSRNVLKWLYNSIYVTQEA